MHTKRPLFRATRRRMFKREDEKATVGTHEEGSEEGDIERDRIYTRRKQSHETFSGIFTLPWM